LAPLPLEHLTVLDLTQARAGPAAVRQLADWGAQTLMIENPAGGEGVIGHREGADFQNLHRNKRSLALDLKRPEGRRIFLRLAQQADAVVENFRPDVKSRLGIDYEAVRRINPRLVYASISGFGQEGPYRDRQGLDQIVQGMGGLMSVTGEPGRGPMRAGAAISDIAAGLYCASGILTALVERERTGVGRWVQVDLLGAQIGVMDFQAARWLVNRDVPGQVGNDHPTIAPMGLFQSSDGHVNVAAGGQRMFARLCAAIGREDLCGDPQFDSGKARLRNRAAVNAEIGRAIRTRTSAEWVELLNEAGVPCGPVYSVDQTFEDPHVKTTGMAAPAVHPTKGPIALVGQPVRFAGLPFAVRSAAPRLSEHTDEVLQGLGMSEREIEGLKGEGIVA